MDPGTVIAIVSAAAEAFDKVKKLFGSKPKIGDPIAELKPYLNAIVQGMETLRQQNIEIYEKLSKLPLIIEGIVADQLDAKALDKAYQDLELLRTLFDQLGEETKFDVVSSEGFLRLMENLNHIFRNDPRVGSLGPLLMYMDFVDLATKQQPDIRTALKIIIKAREDRLGALKDIFIDQYKPSFINIQAMLQTQFFASSNIETLGSIHELKWVVAADRTIVETYYVSHREEVVQEDCCRTRYVTVTETRQRDVPDQAFASARAVAVGNLEKLLPAISITEDAIGAVQSDLAQLRWYSNQMLASDKALGHPASFLFDPSDEEKLDKGMLLPFMPRAGNCYSH
ncbi:hypothetical protein [Pseudomonas sp. S3E12]|uniref:hypothetical protein n=1 Tax=Pseudomonas sp. S3E12 TaxID=1873126 RepID=UPI00081C02B0|nr:hypothetical protein [Pseudomonas sp. S3E12]OCW24989.1 hypothetical protein BB029_12040 [Pseudomonas sp. S3E12]